jgi:hypothetical protein
MMLSIDFFTPVRRPCDLCGRLDDAGGVRLQDDTGARRVFCRQCTLGLVHACLGLPHGIPAAAPLNTGQLSGRQPAARAS